MPKDQSAMHGDIRREESASSVTQFGWVMAGFFALVALLPLTHGGTVRLWALAVAAAFALATVLAPEKLQPLNKAWHKLGLVLHYVMGPLVMGVLFFLVIAPFGIFFRARGKKFLALGYEPNAKSYWVKRTPPGPAPKSFEDQF